jgi:hypothetical protein
MIPATSIPATASRTSATVTPPVHLFFLDDNSLGSYCPNRQRRQTSGGTLRYCSLDI